MIITAGKRSFQELNNEIRGRGLLEVDFHPGWLLLNLALVLAEIFCIMRLENWVIPVTVLTAIVCAINFREIFSMLNKLVGKFLHRKKE